LKKQTENMRRKVGMGNRLSLRDVAQEAGVHYSTVSLALRDSPLIAAETRLLIKAAAARLGYRPDPVLGALNAYRTSRAGRSDAQTIGWIVHRARGEIPARQVPLYREYKDGAAARAEELGCRLEVFTCGDERMTTRRLSKVLVARGISAVIVGPLGAADTFADFDFAAFSAVAIGYTLRSVELNMVTNQHSHAVTLALQNLRALGYRRIGFALPYAEVHLGGCDLLAAYWRGYHTTPLNERVSPLIGYPWMAPRLKVWLDEQQPEVLLTDHDCMPGWPERCGYPVPGRLGLASLSITDADTKVSGIYQNNLAIGAAAVDQVLAQMHRNERGVPALPHRVMLPGVWRAGATAPGVASRANRG
jgi:LacI family transcriptional regulator